MTDTVQKVAEAIRSEVFRSHDGIPLREGEFYELLARAAIAAMSEWCTDMSQAPRDGTIIIISNGHWASTGWWSESIWLGKDRPGWVTDDERASGIVHRDIKYWRHLPLPPEGE